ncbi:MAG: ECF transporter S component [Desulfobacterales bacterium]|nr:ECF transporter S component [Desulfobacterales bacterium]
MAPSEDAKKLFQVGIIAAFATLAFVGTTVIRVPIPATGGYFNLGDTFVMTAALLYGPGVGALVGLIGPAAADAVGFPQFILATAVVKCCEGGVVGLLGARRESGRPRPVIALILGILVLVAGYFIFEAFIYPAIARAIPFFAVTDLKAAIAEIVPNLLQGIISAVIAFGICRLFQSRD